MPVAQVLSRPFRVAFRYEAPDISGTHGHAVQFHLGDYVTAYPSALAELLQLLRRTFSHIAEAMVMSHNKVDRAQFGDQSILNISFPGRSHHFPVENSKTDLIDRKTFFYYLPALKLFHLFFDFDNNFFRKFFRICYKYCRRHFVVLAGLLTLGYLLLPNIVVTVERLDGSAALGGYTRAFTEGLLAEFPGAHVLSVEPVTLHGGHEGCRLVAAYRSSGFAVTLTQYWTVTEDIVTSVGQSCAVDAFDALAGLFGASMKHFSPGIRMPIERQ